MITDYRKYPELMWGHFMSILSYLSQRRDQTDDPEEHKRIDIEISNLANIGTRHGFLKREERDGESFVSVDFRGEII